MAEAIARRDLGNLRLADAWVNLGVNGIGICEKSNSWFYRFAIIHVHKCTSDLRILLSLFKLHCAVLNSAMVMPILIGSQLDPCDNTLMATNLKAHVCDEATPQVSARKMRRCQAQAMHSRGCQARKLLVSEVDRQELTCSIERV